MSRPWHLPGIMVAILVILGPLFSFAGLGPAFGFRLFFYGVLIAAISGLALAGAAAFASATGRAWRRSALRASVVPLLVALAVAVPTLLRGQHPIHDVTTDPEDTLQFTPDVAARRPAEPREQVLALQSENYPDIRPLIAAQPVDAVFEAALATARAQSGWDVIRVDEERGRIEAVATSRIFRFEDDVVIRVEVEEEEYSSRVDARSRSRVGQSDLGANAARIRAYLGALQASLE